MNEIDKLIKQIQDYENRIEGLMINISEMAFICEELQDEVDNLKITLGDKL